MTVAHDGSVPAIRIAGAIEEQGYDVADCEEAAA